MGEFAKGRYILSSAEEGLDFEGFVGADTMIDVIGINDSWWAIWDDSKHSRSTQAGCPSTFCVAACVVNVLDKISIVLFESHVSCIDGDEFSDYPFRGQC